MSLRVASLVVLGLLLVMGATLAARMLPRYEWVLDGRVNVGFGAPEYLPIRVDRWTGTMDVVVPEISETEPHTTSYSILHFDPTGGRVVIRAVSSY